MDSDILTSYDLALKFSLQPHPMKMTMSQCIHVVNRGDWLGSTANIKRANKDAKIYVGRSTTLHNILFCTHTLCMNYVTNTFLLVSSSVRSKQLLCFAHDQGEKRTKTYHKELCFYNHHSPVLRLPRLIYYDLTICMAFVNLFHNGIVFSTGRFSYKFFSPLKMRFDNSDDMSALFRRKRNVFDNLVLLILSPVRSPTPDTKKALEALAAVERLQSQLL